MICLDPALDEAPAPELAPLTMGAILRAQRAGAQILDTRSGEDFAAGHLDGSTHIGLTGRFARWAKTLLSPDRPIVLVCTPGSEHEVAGLLERAGLNLVMGYLNGGIEALRGLVALIRHPARITSPVLRRRLARGPLSLIDVRDESEWRREAIPGSVNIPLEHLRERLAKVPAGRLVVFWLTGERWARAASLLVLTGRMNVVDLVGGMEGWKAA